MANVMVVDDEEAVRQLFQEILIGSGHIVIEAENGEEAIKILNTMSIDLVVTDLVMPEKSGLELIMDIAEIHPKLPIIAISGGGGITGRFDYLPIAKLIGAKRIVNKPFKINDIRVLIKDILDDSE